MDKRGLNTLLLEAAALSSRDLLGHCLRTSVFENLLCSTKACMTALHFRATRNLDAWPVSCTTLSFWPASSCLQPHSFHVVPLHRKCWQLIAQHHAPCMPLNHQAVCAAGQALQCLFAVAQSALQPPPRIQKDLKLAACLMHASTGSCTTCLSCSPPACGRPMLPYSCIELLSCCFPACRPPFQHVAMQLHFAPPSLSGSLHVNPPCEPPCNHAAVVHSSALPSLMWPPHATMQQHFAP